MKGLYQVGIQRRVKGGAWAAVKKADEAGAAMIRLGGSGKVEAEDPQWGAWLVELSDGLAGVLDAGGSFEFSFSVDLEDGLYEVSVAGEGADV